MAKPIDNKIVSMEFDSLQANKNIDATVKNLQKLEGTITSAGASAGGLSAIGSAVSAVEAKFSTLQLVAANVLSNIANRAISAGEQFVKSVSVDQVTAGWSKYAEKTTAVQTIMNAVRKETESEEEAMKRVNDQLERLNWFTDETSYNFTDMTNNIGKFTAQGVELDTAVTAMEGISTWASLSGQGVQQASMAMYNLAQALSAGSVKTKDWMSIENANMATQEFKQTVIDTAIELGELSSNTKINTKTFRESLSEGWFTTDVLLAVLNKYGKFADELSKYTEETDITATKFQEYLRDFQNAATEDAKNDVLSKAVVGAKVDADRLREIFEALSAVDEKTGKAIYGLGQKAFKAAQEAKTFAEAINATKDAVSTGFLNVFEGIFGDYLHAKDLWTKLANDLYDIFAEPLNEVNELISDWKDLEDGLGNREDLVKGLYDAMDGIKNLLGAIKEVWEEVFPPKTAKDIGNIVMRFKEWAAALKANEFTKFRDILRGVLTIIKNVGNTIKTVIRSMTPIWDLVKDIFSDITTAIQNVSKSASKLGGHTAEQASRTLRLYVLMTNIANVLRKVYDFIKESIPKISSILKPVFDFIWRMLIRLVRQIPVILDWLGGVWEKLKPILISIWDWVKATLPKIWNAIKDAFTVIKPYFESAWAWLKDNIPKAWEWVKAAGAKLWPYIKAVWAWLKINIPLAWEWIKTTWDKVKPYLQQAWTFISGKIAELKQKIADAGGIGTILKNTFGGIWSTISKVFSSVKNALSSFFTGDNRGLDMLTLIKRPFEMLFKVFSYIFKNARKFLNAGIDDAMLRIKQVLATLGETLKNIRFKNMLPAVLGFKAVVNTIVKAIVALRSARAIKQVGNMFESIGDTFDAIRNRIRLKNTMNFVNLIKKFAIGLAMLAGAIFLINKVMGKGDDLKDTLVNLGIIALILIAMNSMSDKLKRRKGYDKAAKAIMIMSAALATIAIALAAFRFVTPQAAIIGLVSLVTMVTLMLAITKKITKAKIPNLYKMAGAVAVMSAALLAMASALIAFRFVTIGSAITALASLAVLFGLMVLISNKTKKMDFSAIGKFAGGMALLSLGVAALGLSLLAVYPAVKAFGSMEFMDIVKGLVAVAGAMLAFVLIGKIAGGAAKPLLALSVAIMAVGVAIGVAAAGFALLSMGLVKLSTIGSQSAKNITAAMSAFGAGLIDIFDKVLFWLNQNKDTIFALIRQYRTEMIKIVFETLDTIIDGIFTTLGKLVDRAPEAVGHLCTFIEKTLDQLNEHIGPLTEKFTTFVGNIIDAATLSLTTIVPKVMTFIETLISKVTDWINTNGQSFVKTLEDLVDAVLGLVPAVIESAKDTFYKIGDIIWGNVSDGIEMSAKKKSGSLIGSISGIIIKTLTGNNTWARLFESYGDAMSQWISNGFKGNPFAIGREIFAEKYPEEYMEWFGGGAIIDATAAELNKFNKIIGEQSGVMEVYKKLYPSAKDLSSVEIQRLRNASDAIMEGTKPDMEKAQEIANLWAQVGYMVPESYMKALDINSPSKVMQKLAGYTMDGLIVGLTQNEDRIEKSAQTIGEKTEEALSDALVVANDILQNEDQLTPVITPVLDLTNVQNGARDINGILSGSNGYAVGASNSMRGSYQYRDYARELINLLKGEDAGTKTINNTFNITGDNPEEIAYAVADIIQRQIDGREKVWA